MSIVIYISIYLSTSRSDYCIVMKRRQWVYTDFTIYTGPKFPNVLSFDLRHRKDD